MSQLTFIIAYMFPETANWLASAAEYVSPRTLHFRYIDTLLNRIIHVGINCEI